MNSIAPAAIGILIIHQEPKTELFTERLSPLGALPDFGGVDEA